jgi:hypothetical protein
VGSSMNIGQLKNCIIKYAALQLPRTLLFVHQKLCRKHLQSFQAIQLCSRNEFLSALHVGSFMNTHINVLIPYFFKKLFVLFIFPSENMLIYFTNSEITGYF